MGRPNGFLEYPRRENPYREVKTRLLDFDDLHGAQPPAVRYDQASRCMNCGVPFCQSDYGCPLHNLIPEWNDMSLVVRALADGRAAAAEVHSFLKGRTSFD